jgi:predicted nucleotidyltransferase
MARLAELCARYGIARPRVVGSVAGSAKPDSDMDVLYKLEPDRRLGWAIEQLAQKLAVQPQSGWPRKTT